METIEILSSIFGVIAGIILIFEGYKNLSLHSLSLHSLMKKLVDKSISTKWHRRILWLTSQGARHGVVLILSNYMEIILIIDDFGLSLQRNNLNNETCKDFSAVYLDCKCVA